MEDEFCYIQRIRFVFFLMVDKKISVVIATYNGEKYICQQLDSILNQTYPIFEILIKDI